MAIELENEGLEEKEQTVEERDAFCLAHEIRGLSNAGWTMAEQLSRELGGNSETASTINVLFAQIYHKAKILEEEA